MLIRDGEPRTATSTFTQLLRSECCACVEQWNFFRHKAVSRGLGVRIFTKENQRGYGIVFTESVVNKTKIEMTDWSLILIF